MTADEVKRLADAYAEFLGERKRAYGVARDRLYLKEKAARNELHAAIDALAVHAATKF